MKVRHRAVLIAFGFLAGCAGSDQPEPGRAMPKENRLLTSLVAAADRAVSAREQLSLVEQAKTPPADINRPSQKGLSTALRRQVSMAWSGPIAPIVHRLASEAGFAIEIFGAPPAAAIIVDIRVDREELHTILENVGLQAGSRADVVIDTRRKVIELHYATV